MYLGLESVPNTELKASGLTAFQRVSYEIVSQ